MSKIAIPDSIWTMYPTFGRNAHPTSFLNILTKGLSKYSRPNFKPCKEAARRFLGYVCGSHSDRVHESLISSEKTSTSPVFEVNVERFCAYGFQ